MNMRLHGIKPATVAMNGRGARPIAYHSGDWSGIRGLGRRCHRARLKLERVLRSALQPQARLALGASVLVASAAVGTAMSPSPDGEGSTGPDAKRRSSPSDFGHPKRRVTDVLLAANAAVMALNWLSKDLLLLLGCKTNELIACGQLWRLVTAFFLHAHPVHFAINMYSLASLGPQVEMVSGGARTAVIYLASGVVATAASYFLCPLPSVGASGAIFGLGAALAVFLKRHEVILGPASKEGLRQLGLAAAINVAYSMVNKKIDNWGHLGGFLAGAVLSYLLGPRLLVTRGEGGARGLQDSPPLPWLAFKGPHARAATTTSTISTSTSSTAASTSSSTNPTTINSSSSGNGTDWQLSGNWQVRSAGGGGHPPSHPPTIPTPSASARAAPGG